LADKRNAVFTYKTNSHKMGDNVFRVASEQISWLGLDYPS